MAKYRGAYRDELHEETAPEATDAGQDPAQEPVEVVDAGNSQQEEEDTYKKRYGDLRRHAQQEAARKDKELAEIKSQLDAATRRQIKFPKSEEEVDAWSQKYPEVSKIIDTIAQKRVHEALEEGRKELDKVTQLETRINREKAEEALIAAHPDFKEIKQDPAFHAWVAEQPQNIQDSLYKNNTDARAAARSIDLYKADKGVERKRKTATRDAARSVGKGGGASAPAPGKVSKYKESDVAKMSDEEYVSKQADIIKAMQEGNFEYDMT